MNSPVGVTVARWMYDGDRDETWVFFDGTTTCDSYLRGVEPTHWMPLPPPPGEQE
jgi:hypothetical protein